MAIRLFFKTLLLRTVSSFDAIFGRFEHREGETSSKKNISRLMQDPIANGKINESNVTADKIIGNIFFFKDKKCWPLVVTQVSAIVVQP
jgi:hypothetical protein